MNTNSNSKATPSDLLSVEQVNKDLRWKKFKRLSTQMGLLSLVWWVYKKTETQSKSWSEKSFLQNLLVKLGVLGLASVSTTQILFDLESMSLEDFHRIASPFLIFTDRNGMQYTKLQEFSQQKPSWALSWRPLCSYFDLLGFKLFTDADGNRTAYLDLDYNNGNQQQQNQKWVWDNAKTSTSTRPTDTITNPRPTIILLHGGFMSSAFYMESLQQLASACEYDGEKQQQKTQNKSKYKYRVVAFDGFGRGFSERNKKNSPLNLNTMVWQLKSLMDFLNIESAILWGVSLGAAIGINFASQYPDRVMGLSFQVPVVSSFLSANRPFLTALVNIIGSPLLQVMSPYITHKIIQRCANAFKELNSPTMTVHLNEKILDKLSHVRVGGSSDSESSQSQKQNQNSAKLSSQDLLQLFTLQAQVYSSKAGFLEILTSDLLQGDRLQDHVVAAGLRKRVQFLYASDDPEIPVADVERTIGLYDPELVLSKKTYTGGHFMMQINQQDIMKEMLGFCDQVYEFS